MAPESALHTVPQPLPAGRFLLWSVVGLASLTAAAVWATMNRTARIGEGLEAVNRAYIPTLKHLNLISGKWESYRRAIEKDIQFSKWGQKGLEIPHPRLTLKRIVDDDINTLQSIALKMTNLSSTRGKGREASLLAERLHKTVINEPPRIAELAVLVQNKKFSDAARLYMALRADHSALARDISFMTQDFEAEASRLQIQAEQDVHFTNTILMIGAVLCLSALMFMALRLQRLLTPLFAWQNALARMASEISKGGFHGLKKRAELPVLDARTPPEIAQLSREILNMATTLMEYEKTIQNQKYKLESLNSNLRDQNQALRKPEERRVHAQKLSLASVLSAQVAHEIRNPLNSMMLQLEMLEDDVQVVPGAQERVRRIAEQVERLERMTEKYLGVIGSQECSGGKQQRQPTCIDELVENTLDFRSAEIQARGVRVELNLAGGDTLVNADADELVQVLQNLLSNALDALDEIQSSRKVICIKTAFFSEGGATVLKLSVEDTGRGVPQEIQSKIFEPFVTSKASGHGLGLSVARQICLEHGGDLRHLGSSRFEVNLPC